MIFKPDLLKGQVALITGGGTGLGFGIAKVMADCGANLAVASRTSEHTEQAAAQLREHGVRALPIEANVRQPDSVQAMVQQTVNEFGRLDILVNNAAGNFYCPSAELTPNGWRAVVETDLYGTFFCSQAVYPIMQRQEGGRIISISMTLHYRGWPMMAHATAAKAGVDALTKTLAQEWAPANITVNAVAPGPIPTSGATKAFAVGAGEEGAIGDEMRKGIPLRRLGTPEDVANMVVYLASPAGAWITGAIFVVDGGSSLART